MAAILRYLSRTDLIEFLPYLLNQSEDILRSILINAVTLAHNDLLAVSPVELIVFLHNLAYIDLKTLAKGEIFSNIAVTICLSQRHVFGQELLGATLQKLVESSPIPTLTARTMIQVLGLCPKIVNFIMGLLQKLVTRQIWKEPKLWHGFIKCCEKTQPQSFSVLLQLPIRYLEESFQICPTLKPQLMNHINNMSSNQRALISQTVLQLLKESHKPI